MGTISSKVTSMLEFFLQKELEIRSTFRDSEQDSKGLWFIEDSLFYVKLKDLYKERVSTLLNKIQPSAAETFIQVFNTIYEDYNRYKKHGVHKRVYDEDIRKLNKLPLPCRQIIDLFTEAIQYPILISHLQTDINIYLKEIYSHHILHKYIVTCRGKDITYIKSITLSADAAFKLIAASASIDGEDKLDTIIHLFTTGILLLESSECLKH